MAGGARKDPCPMLCPLAGLSLSAPVSCAGRGREGGVRFLQRGAGSPCPRVPGLRSAQLPQGDARVQLHGCLPGIAACQLQEDGHDVRGQHGRGRARHLHAVPQAEGGVAHQDLVLRVQQLHQNPELYGAEENRQGGWQGDVVGTGRGRWKAGRVTRSTNPY